VWLILSLKGRERGSDTWGVFFLRLWRCVALQDHVSRPCRVIISVLFIASLIFSVPTSHERNGFNPLRYGVHSNQDED